MEALQTFVGALFVTMLVGVIIALWGFLIYLAFTFMGRK